MTTLTIKCPAGQTPQETKVIKTFYRMCPAFYTYSSDEITLTSAIFNRKYKKHICEIIDHEYQHAILHKLEGKSVSHALDNLLKDTFDWI